MIDENSETIGEDDLQLCLYNQNPGIWFPEYDKGNPDKPAKAHTLLFEKKIVDDEGKQLGTAYLLETHKPGQITWSSYYKAKGSGEEFKVSPLEHFADELYGVQSDTEISEDNDELTLNTNCTYSLVQNLKNQTNITDFFGKSDFTLPVVSKLNALNNYANLADAIIVTNAFPKLILSENASKMLERIIQSTSERQQSEVTTPDSLLTTPTKPFLNSQSYLRSWVYSELVNQMKAFEDGGRGETKYLTNDFSLEEIRKQHDILIRAMMTELGISEVFYNPSLSTGAQSGVAYKRLMTTTLNNIEVTKRKLEPFIKKIVYTMLELAKNNNLIDVEPEMPSVQFFDGIINDEAEELQNLVTKVQNQFIPLVDAIKQVNSVDDDRAREIMAEIQGIVDELETVDPELEEETVTE